MPRNRAFNLITVPEEVHSQIRYLERVCVQLGAATDPKEIHDLYTILCYARKFLYETLEDRCERVDGEQVANLRFT